MANFVLSQGVLDAGSGKLGAKSEGISVAAVNGNARVVLKAPGGWSSATVSLKSLLLQSQPGEYTDDLPTARDYTSDTDEVAIDVADEAWLVFQVTVAGSAASVPVR